MAAFKILNLLAATTLALVACSFSATPVNALSVESGHAARHFRPHGSIMKKRQNTRRCKPRPSSSAVPAPQTTSTEAPPPAQTPPPQSSNGGDDQNNGGNDGNTSTDQPPPPTETPPPPPPSNGARKAGLAWPLSEDDSLRNMVGPGVGWIYTWSPWTPSIDSSLGIQSCQMLWGDKQIGDFQSIVGSTQPTCVMGFNEPNQPDQANMDPSWAAQVWKDNIQPLKQSGAELISPACTNAPSATGWYTDFFNACGSECTFDGLATHYYGTSAQDLIDYITQLHNTFGMPIWLTEYACQNFSGGPQCSVDQTWSFHQTVKSFMDNTPWVAAYAAFGAMHDMYNVNPDNQLLGSDHLPTALGYFYIG